MYSGDGVVADCFLEDDPGGGGVCFGGGVGGFLGISKESIGLAGRSFETGRGGVVVPWPVCLECEGDRARPMRLGRQLDRLYALGGGDFGIAACGCGCGCGCCCVLAPASPPIAIAPVIAAADDP